MSRWMRLLAGLVLVALPLAAHGEGSQGGGKPDLSKVPKPVVIDRGLDQVPPQARPPLSFEITFDRNPVRVGEDSVVTLKPEDVILQSPFVFTVAFGDGTTIEVERGKAAVVHAYRSPGLYNIEVSVSPVPGSEIASFTPAPAVSNNNTSISVVDVELEVSPRTLTTGERVSFSTQFETSDPNIRYRFTFGDGSSSGWLATPGIEHIFDRPDNYPNVFVEVGRSAAGLADAEIASVARSASVPIQVNAPQPPVLNPNRDQPPEPGPVRSGSGGQTDPWPMYAVTIVAAIAVIAVIGYSAKHALSSVPRVTLEGHRDPAALRQVVDGRAHAIDIKLRLHRGDAACRISIGTGEAQLVTAIRRTRG